MPSSSSPKKRTRPLDDDESGSSDTDFDIASSADLTRAPKRAQIHVDSDDEQAAADMSDSSEEEEQEKEQEKTNTTGNPTSRSKSAATKLLKLVDPGRARRLNKIKAPNTSIEGRDTVLYWCSRDQRVQDNWALLYAHQMACNNNLALEVCFCLVPKFLEATERQYYFMIEGLREIEDDLARLGIPFRLLMGADPGAKTLPDYCKSSQIAAVVTDFSPLRVSRAWTADAANSLQELGIPLWQVDAHNVVPCWIASDKLEYAARTIRPKIMNRLSHWLVDIPPVPSSRSDSGRKPFPSRYLKKETFFTSIKEQLEAALEKKDLTGCLSHITDLSNTAMSASTLESTLIGRTLQQVVKAAKEKINSADPAGEKVSELLKTTKRLRSRFKILLDQDQKDLPEYVIGPVDWGYAASSLEINRSVRPVKEFTPGPRAGLKELNNFMTSRFKLFANARNDPNRNALSNLSPWLHFGQISAQRCALVAKHKGKSHSESVKSFIEELVVRRELSENFCYYEDNYDNIDCAKDWARSSLDLHTSDKREYVYSVKKFEHARTHDPLWNAAQNQLLITGKIHGFMRMYWAKKILEWSDTPSNALSCAIYLNDKYSLDGRDPNGYVGCAWSILGIHDMGWTERPIFGKIRFMNYNGCKRKFDVQKYERSWNKAKQPSITSYTKKK
eukprot:UC4_evm1s7